MALLTVLAVANGVAIVALWRGPKPNPRKSGVYTNNKHPQMWMKRRGWVDDDSTVKPADVV